MSNQQLKQAILVTKKLDIMPNTGIIFLKVQKNPDRNPAGISTSMVIDCDSKFLLPNYPIEVKEKPLQKTVKPSSFSWGSGYRVTYLHLPKIRGMVNEENNNNKSEKKGQINLITSYDITALKEVAKQLVV